METSGPAGREAGPRRATTHPRQPRAVERHGPTFTGSGGWEGPRQRAALAHSSGLLAMATPSIEPDPKARPGEWTRHDEEVLLELVSRYGESQWEKIAGKMRVGFTGAACRARWPQLRTSVIKVRTWRPRLAAAKAPPAASPKPSQRRLTLVSYLWRPRQGPWTREEDILLRKMVAQYGTKRWSLIASRIRGRIGKQCRERWLNHLDPDVKKFGAPVPGRPRSRDNILDVTTPSRAGLHGMRRRTAS